MTSIELIFNWMTENQYFIGNDLLVTFEKAKEAHKAEIADAYYAGEFDCGCKGTGQDYYNKTFKKD